MKVAQTSFLQLTFFFLYSFKLLSFASQGNNKKWEKKNKRTTPFVHNKKKERFHAFIFTFSIYTSKYSTQRNTRVDLKVVPVFPFPLKLWIEMWCFYATKKRSHSFLHDWHSFLFYGGCPRMAKKHAQRAVIESFLFFHQGCMSDCQRTQSAQKFSIVRRHLMRIMGKNGWKVFKRAKQVLKSDSVVEKPTQFLKCFADLEEWFWKWGKCIATGRGHFE